MVALVMRSKGTILCSLLVLPHDKPTSLRRDLERSLWPSDHRKLPISNPALLSTLTLLLPPSPYSIRSPLSNQPSSLHIHEYTKLIPTSLLGSC